METKTEWKLHAKWFHLEKEELSPSLPWSLYMLDDWMWEVATTRLLVGTYRTKRAAARHADRIAHALDLAFTRRTG